MSMCLSQGTCKEPFGTMITSSRSEAGANQRSLGEVDAIPQYQVGCRLSKTNDSQMTHKTNDFAKATVEKAAKCLEKISGNMLKICLERVISRKI